jgi:predicted O-linked N-acetylglucosamine transferase (SPINDLY family)
MMPTFAVAFPVDDSAGCDDACDKAMRLQIAGRADLAEQMYVAILAAEPNHALANHCLGMLNVQLLRPANGLPYLRTALNANPELPDYWLGYIEAMFQAGEIKDAISTLALARQHGLAGAAVEELAQRLNARRPHPSVVEPRTANSPSQPSRAARRREARLTGPQDTPLLALVEQRRFDEARAQAAAMTAQFPLHGLGWKILGAMLWVGGNSEDALAAMRRSAHLMPTDAETHSNLGMTLAKLAQFEEAAVYLNKAIEIDPTFAAARYRQGMSYELQGRYAEAEVSLRTAISLKGNSLSVDDQQGYSNLLYVLGYNPNISADALFAEHCRYGECFEAPLRGSWPRHANNREPHRRLEVGFVSGDFRDHAMATFIEPVLARLAPRMGLTLHAYSNSPVEDQVTARLRDHFAHWHTVSNLSDAALAAQIIEDRIDVLIDLSGHTGFNRLPVFARKPAPIQVSWMGYPGTTGLRAMDYYLTDPQWLPSGRFDAQFTEKLVYLPANAPFQPHPAAPDINALPALRSGVLTFGSFNRLGKINAATVRLWSALLLALPAAKMLLGGMPSNIQQSRLLELFSAQGVAPERLTCLPRCGMDAYLALHHEVDICLDTYPYTGGTTTLHALWMGVPTLTLAGGTPAGRQSIAILAPLDLEDFVAADAADFVAKGLDWAGRLDELAALRTALRARLHASPTRKPALVADALERALRHMWHRWCRDLQAESFANVTAD